MALAVVVGLAAAGALAQAETAPATRSTRAPRRPAAKPAPVSAKPIAALERQAEHALANDQQILARFDAIMSELQAVKIRVLRKPQNPH